MSFHKTIGFITLMVLVFEVFSSVYPVQSVETAEMITGVNYEGPYDWHYGVTSSELDQDFQLFQENNVNYIVVNIIWSTFQTSVNPAQYNTYNIANVKRVLGKAEEYNMSVCLSFFQYWSDTSLGVPSWCIDPWTGNRRTIAIVRDRTIRSYFLEMVGDLVDEFKSSSAIKSWSLLNEPIHSGSYNSSQLSAEREEFHLLIEDGSTVIRERDDRPITVRFTLPYSPWHTRTWGDYDTFVDFDRVMQSLDFMSINTYANPSDYGTSASWMGTTWGDFAQAVQDTKNASYPFWVSEFGSYGDDEAQRQHYESALQIFQDLGVDACFGWAWVHDDGAEPYNICYGNGLPRPPFYELNLEPPLISEVLASDISGTNATISWVTNKPSDSLVTYGSTLPLGTTASNSTLFTEHSVELTDLLGATTYFYEVQSTDASGKTAIDNNGGDYYTFSTPPSDSTPPEILNPTGDAEATTGESASVSATITDNEQVADANINYTPIDGTEITTSMTETSSDMWTATVPIADDRVGVVAYYMTAQDLEGNTVRDPATGVYNITVTDNDLPVAVAGSDQAVQVGETVYFDGSGSTDNIGVVSYLWDFDESNGVQQDANGVSAFYVYNVEGVYTVTLSVADAAGNVNTDVLQVNVTQVPVDPTVSLTGVIYKEELVRGQSTFSRAAVTITISAEGSSLGGAVVNGYWSGSLDQVVSDTTTSEGTIEFDTRWVKQAGTFTFTVTSVEKDGVTYVLTGESVFNI